MRICNFTYLARGPWPTSQCRTAPKVGRVVIGGEPGRRNYELSRKSRLVTQAAEREWELARAHSQWLKQAAASLPGESVSRGFADRGALEGYPSHYTSLVKPEGHISGLDINRYVCFSFRGHRTIFGWDIANSIFDLENSRSRSWPRSNPMVTFEAYVFAFRFVAIGPFWLRYSQFDIWPWKFKVKVTTKIDQNLIS